ncbi:hypothetical protein PHMEG_0007379 [Phytophthora megakarya]|uniref:Uncharacterized protein n=1 Tax=Phytophthora megakarya TaxID=4795 RepID=A0A225WML8_9STRA|nr:hypothetical protein PHMEG_0007379 [Phytophthora megakarya]
MPSPQDPVKVAKAYERAAFRNGRDWKAVAESNDLNYHAARRAVLAAKQDPKQRGDVGAASVKMTVEVMSTIEEYIDEYCCQTLTAMLLHFNVRSSEQPTLQKVQKVVCYYRRIKLGGSDTTATVVAAVRGEEEHEPVIFDWDLDMSEGLAIGNGSDENSFIVGFSTKAVIRQTEREPGIFIFHVYATYKTNQVDYPVFVCGMTDAARTFHLLALFQESHYTKALTALRWFYHKVVGQPISVAFVISDADGSQYNALDTVVYGYNSYTHLMCYYHLISKIVERTKGLPKEMNGVVLRDMYDLHYSTSLEDYNTNLGAVELR